MQLTQDLTNTAAMALGRATPRVAGPFDGRRCGALTTPLRIHDLSMGGCLIESHYEATTGRRIKLEIELPYAGWIELDAYILYLRENFGFAVKFVDIDENVKHRLAHVIDRLLTKSPADE